MKVALPKLIRGWPAAFLFDLDGTLVDTEMTWARAIVAWLADRGVAATLPELVPIVFGHSWMDIHAALHRAYPQLPPHTALEDGMALREAYARLRVDPASTVIASSVAFFRKVARLAPCVIVSGSPHDDVVAAARLCGIDRAVRFVLGGEDYGRGKPAPDGFLKAAELLDVDASECVVIEDSTAGVKSARAAGMHIVGLDRNRVIRQDFTGVDWLVGDLGELDVDAVFGVK